MAEAGVETPLRNNKYYCHQCSEEISPQLPEYVCPSCNSGFIEEVVTAAQSQNSIENDSGAAFSELFGGSNMFHGAPRRHHRDNEEEEDDHHHHHHRQQFTLHSSGPNGTRITLRTMGPSNPLEGILHHLLGGIAGGSMFSGIPLGMNLHGNPQDYAWSSQGLDAIISQLLNQIDGSGPPPADDKKIEELESIIISKEQADACIQCPVCLEYFSYDDDAKKLPCLHCYHEDCIVPWLKLHGTCPVCRKDLDLEDTTDKEYPLASE